MWIQILVAFIVGVVVGLLIAWFYWRKPLEAALSERDTQIRSWKSRSESAESKTEEVKAKLAEKEQEIGTVRSRPIEVKPDDLKRIEGIGPKIAQVLQDAGVLTFAQLAATEVSRLEQILTDAGMTLADPVTWPEQAGLAAKGSWEALKKLQDELSGGRREG